MGKRKPIITVTSQNIIGSLPTFSKYINISSAPNDVVMTTIARIPNTLNKITPLSLNGRSRYIHDTKLIMTPGKIDKVVMIIDEDDMNRDIKIRNICARNKYQCIGKIMFKKEKSKCDDKSGSVTIERFANQHHKKSVITALAAGVYHSGVIKNLTYATIVKTDDDHAGSIAGLTVALNMRGVSFHIVHGHVTYDEGWITSRKRIKFMKVTPRKNISDINPEDDKLWQYKTGYDNYFNTDKGPCEVTMLTSDNINQKGKMQAIFTKIKNMFTRVKQWIIKMFKIKEKTNNNEHKLAWTEIIRTCSNMTNTTCLTYSVSQDTNASSQIKKANKLISSMQVNKMLAKVGPTGDKTILNKGKDAAFDAYIAATTSYNVSDAVIHANNLSAKQNRKNRLMSMYLSTTITVTYLILMQYHMLAITVLTLALILSLIQQVKPEALILLNMLLTSGSLGAMLLSMTIAIIELIIDPPSSTRTIRTTIYMVVWLISKL